MDKMKFLYSCLFLFVAQIVSWFQVYGHVNIPFLKENKWMAYVMAIPMCYLFMTGINYGVEAFKGMTWAPRILTFTMGILSFAFLAAYFNGEPITPKTLVCVGLAVAIICVQIFMK